MTDRQDPRSSGSPGENPPTLQDDEAGVHARISVTRALALLHSTELDDPLDPLLQLVGEGMQVSRSYLFQFRDDRRLMDNTHEWCAPGVEPQRDRLQDVPTDTFPWWMDRLRSGNGVAVSTLDELPPEADAEREILRSQEITAVLVLPLTASTGELIGFMGFDEVKGPREWSERETESLKLICQLGTRELELRRTARELRRSQERLIRTERIARVGGWEFDPATGSTWWSDQAAHILGVPNIRGPVTLFDFFQRLHPDDRDRARRTALAAMDEDRSFRFECRLLPDANHVRHVEVHGDVLHREDDTGVVVGTLQDITDRRRLEDHLSQAQRMEAVGKLAGGVAHDFNNLLSVILGNTEILLERDGSDQAPDDVQEDLLQIHGAAERGAALTRKLLAFSRRQVLDPRQVDLNEVLNGMREMLRRLLPEELELEVDLSREVGSVRMDRGQLEQIVMSLAVNARDAMEPGGTLRIATNHLDLTDAEALDPAQILDPGSYAVLSVADDGHGMPPEVKSRVFEPFFTTRDAEEGTGMGLASVYGVARQSGGGITVESEPGVGSHFQIFLPMDGSGELEGGEPHAVAPVAADGPGPTDDHAGLNVLLVEDDPAVARMARRVLERAGYRVMVAHRPADAIRMSRERDDEIRLLITDVVMPDMRGRDLVREIRKDREDIRTLFISGYPLGREVRDQMVEPGAPFLRKPFSTSRLLHAVRESLESKIPAGG